MFASLHTASLATRRVQSVGSVSRLLTKLQAAFATRHQRNSLAQLDDRILADIGITRDQARIEANRALWDFASRPLHLTPGRNH